ncbi:Aste57867_1003 [Aphanomyces stellatus]|uniref:Choline transporter-like protein n=1 Tax=Aphanomyces stellatus TaxID=120398 RepID=A0A485K875_9STRA|nr:hypothetical protein As57867_001002 [Aphanomyces stellatus]VFT78225.1 Aste57867_1003 [Aphanomyces stellatus]
MARSEPRTPTGAYQNDGPKRECNDVFFLIIFLGLVGMTVFFAASYGSTLADLSDVRGLGETTGFRMVLKYAAYAGATSTVLSIVWILIMMVAGELVIWVALLAMIASCVAAAIFMTKRLHDLGQKYYWWPAAVFGGMALLMGLYTYCIRHRVKFAAKHLKVAGSSLFRLPVMFVVVIVMVAVQLAWGVAWIAGTFGLLNKLKYIVIAPECSDKALYATDACTVTFNTGGFIGIFIAMLLVFFWGALVVDGVVATTVAGSVASWKNNAAVPCIVLSSWLRAFTLNLGSICFGSLIVAILETIRMVINMLQAATAQGGNGALSCLLCCVSCIVGCIESAMETFNRFAFTYVGIHGFSFVTAGRHVSSMFAAKGWTALVNDDLVGYTFFLGNLLVGAISAWIALHTIGADVSNQVFPGVSRPEYIVAACAFLVGYIVNSLFMGLMNAAVTTVFVLWAEDPASWQLTHPDHYARLHAAWLEIYPDEYNNGLGKALPPSAV